MVMDGDEVRNGWRQPRRRRIGARGAAGGPGDGSWMDGWMGPAACIRGRDPWYAGVASVCFDSFFSFSRMILTIIYIFGSLILESEFGAWCHCRWRQTKDVNGNGAKPTNHVHNCVLLAASVVASNLAPNGVTTDTKQC